LRSLASSFHITSVILCTLHYFYCFFLGIITIRILLMYLLVYWLSNSCNIISMTIVFISLILQHPEECLAHRKCSVIVE
jgi:hypothetical protein